MVERKHEKEKGFGKSKRKIQESKSRIETLVKMKKVHRNRKRVRKLMTRGIFSNLNPAQTLFFLLLNLLTCYKYITGCEHIKTTLF